MTDYRTKGTYGLGGQVKIANKNSNVDYDYGAYESFGDIPQTLYDTVQVGKTIGIVNESGKITEYWWQMREDGTYGWVEKGISRKEIESILADYSAKDDVKQEVVTVLTCTDTYPDVSEMNEGDMFIFTGEAQFKEPGLYHIDENGDDWKIDADKEVIYKTADTSKLYVWKGSEFVEVGSDTPVVIEDTIYVGKEWAIPMAAASLPDGTYTAIVLEKVESGVVITDFDRTAKISFIKWLKDVTHLGLKECKALVDNIDDTPINLAEYNISLTDADIEWCDANHVVYTSGTYDREVGRYTLIKIDGDMYLQTRDGWAELAFLPGHVPAGSTIRDIWVWHYYDYRGHKHSIDEIEGLEDLIGNDGEVELEFADDKNAEMVIPIESEMLDAIVAGDFESSDTAMFTGTSECTPLTHEEINGLVNITIAAMKANK